MNLSDGIIITYTVIISIVTVSLGAFTKAFIEVIPDRLIPLQNLIVGIISGLLCYYFGIMSSLIIALLTCIYVTMGVRRNVRLITN